MKKPLVCSFQEKIAAAVDAALDHASIASVEKDDVEGGFANLPTTAAPTAPRLVTAATITDAQIKALREDLVAEIARLASTPEAWTMPLDKALQETDWALSHGWGFVVDGDGDVLQDRRRAARGRCAEILNDRKAVKTCSSPPET